MADCQKIVEDFKPTLAKDDIDVILKVEGLKSIEEFYSKYASTFAEKTSFKDAEGWKVKFVYELKLKTAWNEPDKYAKKEAVLKPEDFGWSKSTELLISTAEEGIINLQTRRTESGRFLFKTTVKLPSEADWASKFCFWKDGKVWTVDLAYGLFTDELSPKMLMQEGFESFSDINEAYQGRVLMPNSVFRELNASFDDPLNRYKPKLLHYTLSELGDVQIFAPKR